MKDTLVLVNPCETNRMQNVSQAFKYAAFVLSFLLVSSQLFAEEATRPPDIDPTRLVWSPTAFQKPNRKASLTNYSLLVWHLDFNINDHVTVGARTITPIGVFALGPTLKLTTSVSDFVHLGFFVEGGFLKSLVVDEAYASYGGGGPIVSLGTPDLFFNASVMTYGGFSKNGSGWGSLPTLGFGWRLGRKVKYNAEVSTFLNESHKGKTWAFIHGVRIFGESLYGDFGFVMPIFDGAMEIYKYLPLGYPVLSFGFAW